MVPPFDDRSDAHLVRDLSTGDERAFEAVMRRYHPSLARYVARLLRDEDRADDVLQEMFLRLWAGRERLSITDGTLRSYLFSAAHRTALTYAGRIQREARRSVDVVLEATPDAGAGSDPLEQVERAELEGAVARAVSALPERCREIYLMSREGGLSYPEIAHALGISVGTVKTQMSRAFTVLYKVAKPFLVVACWLAR